MHNSTLDKNRVVATPLTAELSKTRPSQASFDGIDEDIGGHIALFVQEVRRTMRFEEMSLASADEVQQSLETINRLKEEIQAHRNTARALKQLLVAQGIAGTVVTSCSEPRKPLLM